MRSGSRSVTQTSNGYNVNKQVQTQSGASKSVNKDVNTAGSRASSARSTATNAWGQSASRERTVEGQGGYATVEGSASTSTGREASGEAVAGRNAYGQPVVAGSVNTKYNGNYAGAAAQNPYGGWTTATAGPYGGKVTTTLPSGYRTTTYYGRPYYSYGGAYYRPYTYGGVPYYYPVPPPYYSSYSSPPAGAVMLMVAGVAYLCPRTAATASRRRAARGRSSTRRCRRPRGAKLKTLPAERVLVTVAGTTYYLYSNTFYRRVVSGGQESFVVVTPPAGVVFVPALPADFEVVQLNTMYFAAAGRYYVPFLATDGKELYVMVDAPPQPPALRPCCPGRPRRRGPRRGAAAPAVTHGRRVARRAGGDRAPGAAGDRRQLGDGEGGRPLPGVPRPRPRRDRPPHRAARRPRVRRRRLRRPRRQDEGQALAQRHADRPAGGRPRRADQDAADLGRGQGAPGGKKIAQAAQPRVGDRRGGRP